jgi:peptidoglycan/xylan/chitin deacetylase (PgdA/CDA1 family)
MNGTLKRAILYVAKYAGLFRLARRYSAKKLRILCYHGLSLGDEHRFKPGVFMRPKVLRQRLKTLRDRGFPVVSLEEGLEGLARGDLPPSATVVTFDDGFYSNYAQGLPILRQFGIPATIYMTTYYVEKDRPIFRLVIQYIFWKTQETSVDLSGLGLPREGIVDFAQDDAKKDELVWQIINHAESRLDEEERSTLVRELAARLGISHEELTRQRSLSLMTTDEIRETAEAGVSVQLHTHRHRFPLDEDAVRREIEDNRTFLESVLGFPAEHFCYPSGIWSERHWPWLEAKGIRSAVTCEPGMNDAATPRLGLRRILDADTFSQVEFEAQIYGFSEILRRLFRRSGHRNGHLAAPHPAPQDQRSAV